MSEPERSEDSPKNQKKKTLLGWFVSREEPDTDYMPDLKSQWGSMNRNERFKFIAGGIVGLVLFIGALLLVYVLLSAITR
jgi:hypothetical protein